HVIPRSHATRDLLCVFASSFAFSLLALLFALPCAPSFAVFAKGRGFRRPPLPHTLLAAPPIEAAQVFEVRSVSCDITTRPPHFLSRISPARCIRLVSTGSSRSTVKFFRHRPLP